MHKDGRHRTETIVPSRMEWVAAQTNGNGGIISTVLFLVIFIGLIYAAYKFLYPARAANHVVLLSGEADARKPVSLSGSVPTIHTGGDFTLSFWIYIDDFNYLASRSKLLFALSPENITTTTRSPLVGMLTPLTNGLMVRAHTTKSSTAPQPATSATAAAAPDITVEGNLQAVLGQHSSMTMFQDSIGEPCDVKEIPLQRWVCITIVSSGRVMDVYIDGKLTRSCILDNVVNVPRSPLKLRLGENGGFGGRYSSVQMWGSQLTPDVIYGLYMMGPSTQKYDPLKSLENLFNLNVTFMNSGSSASTSTSTSTSQLLQQSQQQPPNQVMALISRF